MPVHEVAFLGPLGTYSHLVARKRYGAKPRSVPLPTILDVCSYVSRHRETRGVVPIENSSGGAIYETVDILLANKPRIHIEEEVTLEVQLALLGRSGEKIRTLYSHFAPLEHCHKWLSRHLPRAKRQVVTSTAVAAQRAALEVHAAALASRRLARMCGLDVLEYPVQADVPNITSFLTIAGRRLSQTRANKTTLAARTPNVPGGLCTFLEAFRDENVNLTRLISRPIRGCPREYAFLVDIEGSAAQPKVKRALAGARRVAAQLRVIDSYLSGRKYSS